MPLFNIHHITRYEYNRPVKESVNEIKIFPYVCPGQQTISQELTITTKPDVYYFYDYWGNKTGIFNVLQQHESLSIESRLLVNCTASPDVDVNFDTGSDALEKDKENNFRLLETAHAEAIKSQAAIHEIAKAIAGTSIALAAQNCCSYIFTHFTYISGITSIETTVDEILALRSGVCQDFAHLMLQVLRSLKIPCRYVSGYICPNKNGMRGEGATHAWVEVYIPAYGWAGIDPTNNCWVTNNHIKLAVGRHFADCTPIKGTFRGLAKQVLSVHVSIGYEDGQVFEEVNNVKMERQPGAEKPVIPQVNDAAIQQQQ